MWHIQNMVSCHDHPLHNNLGYKKKHAPTSFQNKSNGHMWECHKTNIMQIEPRSEKNRSSGFPTRSDTN